MYAIYQGETFKAEGQKYPIKKGQLYEIDVYPKGYSPQVINDTVFIKDESHGCISSVPYNDSDWQVKQSIIEYEVSIDVSGLCPSEYQEENFPDTGDFDGSIEWDDEFEEGTFEGTYIVNVIADTPEEAMKIAKKMYEEVADSGVLTDCSMNYSEVIGKTDVTRREFANSKDEPLKPSEKEIGITR